MELTNCSAALEQGCSEPGADSEQISEEFTTRLWSPKRIYFSVGR